MIVYIKERCNNKWAWYLWEFDTDKKHMKMVNSHWGAMRRDECEYETPEEYVKLCESFGRECVILTKKEAFIEML